MEPPSFKFVKPQQRKWVRAKRISPFPVPISSISGIPCQATKWCYFTGYLINNFVAIKHSGDIDFLYSMGFFGKGHLSQNQPKNVKPADKQSSDLKITSRRWYLRHVAWSSGTSEDLLDTSESVEKHKTKTCQGSNNPQEASSCTKLTQEDGIDKPIRLSETNPSGDIDSSITMDNVTSHDEILKTFKFSKKEDDPWENATAHESAEFWGIESKPEDNLNAVTVDVNAMVPVGHRNIERKTIDKSPVRKADPWDNNTKVKESPEFVNVNELGDNFMNETESESDSDIAFTDSKCLLQRTPGKNTKDLCDVKGPKLAKSKLCPEENIIGGKQETSQNTWNSESESETVPLTLNSITSVEGMDGSYDTDGKYPDLKRHKQNENTFVDDRCRSDHEDGDLFVVNDTDESEAEGSEKRRKWEPALKRDPYPMSEELHLSLQEAFFLSYCLGCLVTLDQNNKPLDLTELWCECRKRQTGFVAKYIAYHNFRSKGWVPKPGLKFGVDLLVYSLGPPFTHATYAVLVIEVDSASDMNEKTLSWRSLAGQHRVIKQAGKELMLCYVIKPRHLTEVDLQSPSCIGQFSVQEVIVRRWMSKQERENLNCVEIP